MFSFSETVPGQFPAETAITQNTVGPVVCGFSRKLDAMIALDATELWEAVTAGLRILGPERVAELATLCGAPHPAEHEALVAEVMRLRGELGTTKANTEAFEAEVIDFFKERAARRPDAEPVKTG